ncbi:MAG TPA: ferredoxin [Elusimicrobia bacterium]|nr:ferredoxin [Elusimicrobiota bacterium]
MVAVVDSAKCVACGACVSSCSAGAISIASVAVIAAAKCVGCGACVEACAPGAISMKSRR